MTDIEMASLASGDAKNQLTTRLAAAETHVKAVTKLKSKLPANERQLAERLLASAEPLIGSLRNDFKKGKYRNMKLAIEAWQDRHRGDLGGLETTYNNSGGKSLLGPVITLTGNLDHMKAAADLL